MAEKSKRTKSKKQEETGKDDQIEHQSKEIEELTDLLKRTQADFINFKSRVEKESKQMLEYSNANLVKDLLPVLDSFELAFKNDQDPEKFKQGVEMIFAQLHEILKGQGLQVIDSVGNRFDPYKHDVLMKEDTDEEEDTIIEEFQKGYMFKDRVIRHAKVKVSK